MRSPHALLAAALWFATASTEPPSSHAVLRSLALAEFRRTHPGERPAKIEAKAHAPSDAATDVLADLGREAVASALVAARGAVRRVTCACHARGPDGRPLDVSGAFDVDEANATTPVVFRVLPAPDAQRGRPLRERRRRRPRADAGATASRDVRRRPDGAAPPPADADAAVAEGVVDVTVVTRVLDACAAAMVEASATLDGDADALDYETDGAQIWRGALDGDALSALRFARESTSRDAVVCSLWPSVWPAPRPCAYGMGELDEALADAGLSAHAATLLPHRGAGDAVSLVAVYVDAPGNATQPWGYDFAADLAVEYVVAPLADGAAWDLRPGSHARAHGAAPRFPRTDASATAGAPPPGATPAVVAVFAPSHHLRDGADGPKPATESLHEAKLRALLAAPSDDAYSRRLAREAAPVAVFRGVDESPFRRVDAQCDLGAALEGALPAAAAADDSAIGGPFACPNATTTVDALLAATRLAAFRGASAALGAATSGERVVELGGGSGQLAFSTARETRDYFFVDAPVAAALKCAALEAAWRRDAPATRVPFECASVEAFARRPDPFWGHDARERRRFVATGGGGATADQRRAVAARVAHFDAFWLLGDGFGDGFRAAAEARDCAAPPPAGALPPTPPRRRLPRSRLVVPGVFDGPVPWPHQSPGGRFYLSDSRSKPPEQPTIRHFKCVDFAASDAAGDPVMALGACERSVGPNWVGFGGFRRLDGLAAIWRRFAAAGNDAGATTRSSRAPASPPAAAAPPWNQAAAEHFAAGVPAVVTLDFYEWTRKFPAPERFVALFKPCAVVKLFLPSLLAKNDTAGLGAAVYVDTDVLFLDDPQRVWVDAVGALAASGAVAAAAAEHGDLEAGCSSTDHFYDHEERETPRAFADDGANTGVVALNFTRARAVGYEASLDRSGGERVPATVRRRARARRRCEFI
ncbi:hypothetical protein JL720_12318 [Aureococcus anophagefferens]|nr:hypothetical protein JL720_12318 [Aureococcus anophagefferens]